jgi:Calx-beta domain
MQVNEAAGGALPPSKLLTGPAPPRRSVCAPGTYDQSVTMSFRTVDGTAKASDSDYVAKTGTLTFNPGETTKTITIEVKADHKKEADETFYLDLFGNSPDASGFTKSRGIGTILNDD